MRLGVLTAGLVLLLAPPLEPVHVTIMVAHMDGAQVVPSTSSEATGRISCGWRVDEFTYPRDCAFHIRYDSLSGPVTGVFVMRGAVGENGTVLDTLASGPVASDTYVGRAYSGEDLWLFHEGLLYAVITTAAFPNGEVRGQFVDETDLPVESVGWGRLRGLFR
jgi:hypothetical protein